MATTVDALLITMGTGVSGPDKTLSAVLRRPDGGTAPGVRALCGSAAATPAGTDRAAGIGGLSPLSGTLMALLRDRADAVGFAVTGTGSVFRAMADGLVRAAVSSAGPLQTPAEDPGTSLRQARDSLGAAGDLTLKMAGAFRQAAAFRSVPFPMRRETDPAVTALLQQIRTGIGRTAGAGSGLSAHAANGTGSVTDRVVPAFGRALDGVVRSVARGVERFLRGIPFGQAAPHAGAADPAARFTPALHAGRSLVPFSPVMAGLATRLGERVFQTPPARPDTAAVQAALSVCGVLAAAPDGVSAGVSAGGSLPDRAPSAMLLRAFAAAVRHAATAAGNGAAQTGVGMRDAADSGFSRLLQRAADAWKRGAVLPENTAAGAAAGPLSGLAPLLRFGSDSRSAAVESVCGAAYHASVSDSSTRVVTNTTVNGGIHITSDGDPSAIGGAVRDALTGSSCDTTFAVDAGIRM